MILTANGELFYTGSHVFGNNETPFGTVGTARGAGWRLDCLGDMRSAGPDPTGRWSHMLDFYPEQVVRTGIQDVWQHAHVSLETCWVPGYWKQKGWDVNYILNQALRWHISSLNIKWKR